MLAKWQENLQNVAFVLLDLGAPKGRSEEGKLALFSAEILTAVIEETFTHFLQAVGNWPNSTWDLTPRTIELCTDYRKSNSLAISFQRLLFGLSNLWLAREDYFCSLSLFISLTFVYLTALLPMVTMWEWKLLRKPLVRIAVFLLTLT